MNAVRRRAALWCALLIAAIAGWPATVLAQSPTAKGRPLVEALQQLQAEGVRVVFSSALVPSSLRVIDEPDAPTPRGRLDQLLAPHGLAVQAGPGSILHVVRAESARRAPRPPEGTIGGRVAVAQTAVPVVGARIRVEGLDLETSTDAAGIFAIPRVPAGPHTVTVEAAGYGSDRESVVVGDGERCTIAWHLSPEPRRYAEHVSVIDDEPWRRDRGIGSEVTLDGVELAAMPGAVADDALRAMHSLPRVSATDDLLAGFTVRGSPYRHVDVVVDGVPARWLQHAAPGGSAGGSLTLLSGLVVERATLSAGAYPRRHGDALGAELSLTLREGSRTARRFQGGLAGRRALLVGEGPIGAVDDARAARGSWLVAARRSLAEWPPDPPGPSSVPFGFSDAFAKIVYDVGRSQQIGVTWLGGAAIVDEEEEPLATAELPAGAARVSLAAVTWRSALGPGVVLRQQASAVTERWWNPLAHALDPSRAANRAARYRADLSQALGRVLVEGGAQIERRTADRTLAVSADQIRGASWQRGGFVHVTWAVAPTLTLSPGVRATWSTLARRAAVSRWIQAEWSPTRSWSLTGSTGLAAQPPDLGYVLGARRHVSLVPERAAHAEVGLEHRVSADVRWQAVAFSRHETDLLRGIDPLGADASPRPSDGAFGNGLRGRARGLELLVARRRALGLSGWLAYAYARTRHVDPATGVLHASAGDRPHTATAAAALRFQTGVALSATLRAASDASLPGRTDASDPRRLPRYVRLDLRLDRRFRASLGEVTVFVEGLNVLDRANLAPRRGPPDPVTGEPGWLAARLPGRRLAAGALIAFR
jgi:hypothetical protein